MSASDQSPFSALSQIGTYRAEASVTAKGGKEAIPTLFYCDGRTTIARRAL
jgi:hypothetical protein